jgi:hypothetical protein
VSPVVEELVQVVCRVGDVSEERREQCTIVEEHSKDGERDKRQRRPDEERRFAECPVQRCYLPWGSSPRSDLRAKGQYPDSRIPTLPAFPLTQWLSSGSLSGHSGGTVPDSHRLPVPNRSYFSCSVTISAP